MTFRRRQFSGPDYWKNRVKQFGKRSVLNLSHPESEYDNVTEDQKARLFPLLKSQLRGDEQTILDLGCGPGRFTVGLAELIQGRGTGVDLIADLLAMAPQSDRVTYLPMKDNIIPAASDSMDVVWICLVLGGITSREDLQCIAGEIQRVLKQDGLLFLVENTSQLQDVDHWAYRSVEFYQKLIHFAHLELLSVYDDVDERISIMAGRTIG